MTSAKDKALEEEKSQRERDDEKRIAEARTIFQVPTSRQWVAIPTDVEACRTIIWREGGLRSARYYVARGYWGTRRDQQIIRPQLASEAVDKQTRLGVQSSTADTATPISSSGSGAANTVPARDQSAGQPIENPAKATNPTDKAGVAAKPDSLDIQAQRRPALLVIDAPARDPILHHPKYLAGSHLDNVLGIVDVFIAAELLEERYREGPAQSFHLKDLLEKKTADTTWLTMELNACFYYGESGTTADRKRFIVYHPPISLSLEPPKIFQHRFTAMALDAAVEAVAQDADKVPDEYKAAAAAGSAVLGHSLNFAKQLIGDPLHRYLADDGIETARYVYEKRLHLPRYSGISDADKVLLALQHVERQDAATANRFVKKMVAARLKSEALALSSLTYQKTMWEKIWESLNTAVQRQTDTAAHTKALADFEAAIGAYHFNTLPDPSDVDGEINNAADKMSSRNALFDTFTTAYKNPLGTPQVRAQRQPTQHQQQNPRDNPHQDEEQYQEQQNQQDQQRGVVPQRPEQPQPRPQPQQQQPRARRFSQPLVNQPQIGTQQQNQPSPIVPGAQEQGDRLPDRNIRILKQPARNRFQLPVIPTRLDSKGIMKEFGARKNGLINQNFGAIGK